MQSPYWKKIIKRGGLPANLKHVVIFNISAELLIPPNAAVNALESLGAFASVNDCSINPTRLSCAPAEVELC